MKHTFLMKPVSHSGNFSHSILSSVLISQQFKNISNCAIWIINFQHWMSKSKELVTNYRMTKPLEIQQYILEFVIADWTGHYDNWMAFLTLQSVPNAASFSTPHKFAQSTKKCKLGIRFDYIFLLQTRWASTLSKYKSQSVLKENMKE